MILHGDSLEVLKTLDADSVDAVVCDPPYGLSFMGKKWDYDVPSVALWNEVIRVLKPGGHALIACGTRTQHRMVVNIEDAGFEIRDVVTWLYGSGFPKSLDVSKAIDKAAGAEREVIGENPYNKLRGSGTSDLGKLLNPMQGASNITAPSTEAAKQWQGFGTALKPACEFWTLARKPLSEPTVAKNVLRWGTGCLNIDASRINNSAWESEDDRSNSNAEHAESKIKQSTRAITASTATNNVEQTLSARELMAPDATSKMDTSCSRGQSPAAQNIKQTEFSGLSTGSFGKNTSGKSRATLLSTTETKTDKTIESKTSNLCPVMSTRDTTSPNTIHAPTETRNTQDAHASSGRWPSNLILDEQAAEMLDEQSGDRPVSGSAKLGKPHAGEFKAGFLGSAGQRSQRLSPNDSGGASRFFYCAKSSKSERSRGLNEFDCATLPSCQSEENTELVTSILKVISALIPNSSIVLSGENIMAIFPKECLSITRTTIQAITELKTWNSLMLSHTSDSMKDAVLKATAGISHVNSAENSSALTTAIGILAAKAGSVTDDAKLVTLEKLSKLSETDAWKTYSSNHPTVKPVRLMEYLCKLITPPGGTVLDPFAGSGSTGVAAVRLGFKFIGIEREKEYVTIAERRIEHAGDRST